MDCRYGIKNNGSCKKRPGRKRSRSTRRKSNVRKSNVRKSNVRKSRLRSNRLGSRRRSNRLGSRRRSRRRSRLLEDLLFDSKDEIMSVNGDYIDYMGEEHISLYNQNLATLDGKLTSVGRALYREYVKNVNKIDRSSCTEYLFSKGFNCDAENCDIVENSKLFSKLYKTLIIEDTVSSIREARKLQKCYKNYMILALKAFGVKNAVSISTKLSNNSLGISEVKKVENEVKKSDVSDLAKAIADNLVKTGLNEAVKNQTKTTS
jgi:hypothetical protein